MNSEIAVGSAVAPAWVSADGKISVFYGDCKTVMAALPQECVHAVISDPPYGMSPDGISRNMDEIEGMKTRGGFAGAEWDAAVPGPSIWREALRVAKPGAHLLSFASTRTYHTMATAAQVAGWRIRDMLSWVYCQGTPKGMDVGKAYDRQAGVEEQRGYIPVPGGIGKDSKRSVIQFKGKREGMYLNPDNPISPEAKKWHGWNTALKTAVEPIAMARKPYEGSLLDNLREHSVGALNTKICAIPCETPVAAPSLFDVGEDVKVETYWPANFLVSREAAQWLNEWHNQDWTGIFYTPKPTEAEYGGGWAATHERDQCEAKWVNELLSTKLPGVAGILQRLATSESVQEQDSAWSMCSCGSLCTDPFHPDITSIISTITRQTIESRICSSRIGSHTNGCMAIAFCETASGGSRAVSANNTSPWAKRTGISGGKDTRCTEGADLATSVASWLTSKREREEEEESLHPTLKPLALMRYLIQLVTPPDCVVLDPFGGSGTTAVACQSLGRRCIIIERERRFVDVIIRRLSRPKGGLF